MCNEKNTVLIISPRLDDVTATAIRPPSHSVAFDSSDREVSSSRCLVYLYNYKTQIITGSFLFYIFICYRVICVFSGVCWPDWQKH